MDSTLLKCYTDQGRVVAVTGCSHDIQIDQQGRAIVEAIIEARHSALTKQDDHTAPLVDRVLILKGDVSPMVSPPDFIRAAMENPDLVSQKMARYYPEVFHRPSKGVQQERRKTIKKTAFAYRATMAGSGSRDGLFLVTLLCKDHLEDRYELTGLMVDSATPAASALQFLADMTDGRSQAVAVFKGQVDLFQIEQTSGNQQETKRRGVISDPLTKTLAGLLDAALVRQGFLSEDPDGVTARSLVWLASLLNSKAIVAIETDLMFCEEAISQAIKDKLEIPLVILQPAAPPDMFLTFKQSLQPSCMVFPMTAYNQLIDPERVAYELLNNGHSALIGCSRINALPEPLRRIIETTIALPRIDRDIFVRIFKSLFNAAPDAFGQDDETWIQYVQPWDMARIARSCQDPGRAFVMLRHRVEDRLTRVTPIHGPSLSDLHGLGEARLRAEMLINDIKAAAAGDIPWEHVDRGMLLAGPPGCGKTALARAIAKDCGIRFVECSAARWQTVNHLGEHLAAMARDFAEARRFEPSILFIDEIDSIGNRENFSGNNASYSTQVVNALLAELQGFSERGKVIIIAATNNEDNVDPALRRAGRLDRVFRVSLPTIDALEKIFAYYLEKDSGRHTGSGSDIRLRPLAEAAFGRTGADVSLMVRGALRRARLERRALCQDDLLAELYQRPLDLDLDRPLKGEGIRRVALHEAGHALVRIKTGSGFGHISFISIVPRPDGNLGFVALKPNANVGHMRG